MILINASKQIRILEWFLKDNVKMKSHDDENTALTHKE